MLALAWPIRLLLCTAGVLAYYRFTKQALFSLAAKATRYAPAAARRRWSSVELTGITELALAAASHVLLVAALWVLTDLPLSALVPSSLALALIPLGLLVGIGEAAASMFVCQLIILWSTRERAPAPTPAGARPRAAADVRDQLTTGVASWSTMSRGGWVRHHLTTLHAFPLPVSIALSSTQVACEEIVFRIVVLHGFLDLGAAAAIALSGLLFTGMQVFFMSTWRAAMFPVVGAAIMAVVHGVLLFSGAGVLPLIAAHAAFFFAAVV